MLTAIGAFFTGMFSSSKGQDLILKGIEKIGGLDGMTSQEKAQFILDYMAATKHQSPMRRFIALAMTILFTVFVLSWLINATVGYYFGISVALELAGAIKVFLTSVILNPFNIILGFYFVVNIAQKIGGK